LRTRYRPDGGLVPGMARARTCYDHLAGRLGVTVTHAMTHRGLLRQDAGFAFTDDGAAWLTEIGVDID
jgi:hypothetical protein